MNRDLVKRILVILTVKVNTTEGRSAVLAKAQRYAVLYGASLRTLHNMARRRI